MRALDVSTVVLDFDDTLYDWVGQWHRSFSAMLVEISRISGIATDELKPTIRRIHQEHHTSEYAFLIEAIPEISLGSPDKTLAHYRDAVTAFKKARDQALVLFPKVQETLATLRESGKTLIVFTESQLFYSKMRFKRFGLDGIIDYLYTSSDHELPDEDYVLQKRKHPPEFYDLRRTVERSVRFGKLKPEPDVLLQILEDMGVEKDRAVYVGDSKYKDVLMANRAELFSVWAKYGASRDRPEYSLLREVSHWTDEDIAREKELQTHEAVADATLDKGFWELAELLGGEGGKGADQ